MDALEARAYLGVQRRVVQSRNMIYKPDSVLEYTCFDRFMPNLAEMGDAIAGDRWFSEYQDQPEWQPPMTTTTEIDNALQNMITNNMPNYIFPNYPHTYLGGHMPPIAGAPPATPEYTCDSMQIVWNYSRCIHYMDHDSVPELEWFYTFDWYSVNDPRQIPNIPPNLASCPVAFGKPDPNILTQFEIAWNQDNAPYVISNPIDPDPLNAPPPDATNVYREDPVLPFTAFSNDMYGTNCGDYLPVATGVIVNTIRHQIPRYREAFCVQPNCYYEPGGDDTNQSINDPMSAWGNGSCTR
jgi:hypothetical protein